MLVRNSQLPLPPFPPCANFTLWFGSKISQASFVCLSRITVPTGTTSSKSSPEDPCFFLGLPGFPGSASNLFLYINRFNTDRSDTPLIHTFPPLPPLPPSGPP